MKHALEIFSVISDVFNDLSTDIQLSDPTLVEDNEHDFDKVLLDEWNEFLQHDDLFDTIVDNFSLSQLETSLLGQEPVSNESQETEVPSAA